MANISKWVGKQIERDLNWQIVNLGVETNDLHDAPILYIAGKDALAFTPEETAKLKQFVEQGGLVVGNADCGNRVFADSFKKLGTELFKSLGSEWRALPEGHPIYADQQYRRVAWKQKPNLLGLSNGVRELMLLFEKEDPARGWQTQAFMGGEREPLAQLMGNIFLYAVDKQNLRTKGETYLVGLDPKVPTKRTFNVARLQYASNWDPEPAGWRRLANVMHNQFATDPKVRAVKLGAGALAAGDAVAHLTGTTKLVLDDKAKQELQKYVAAGGTLIVDAAGGSSDFANSAEAALVALFGKDKQDLVLVPVKHPVYSAGNKIEEVEYRTYAKRIVGNSRLPRVRGIEVGGRMAVFFSGEDLSAGLVGQPVDGIHGYAPAAVSDGEGKIRAGATEIMTNLVLYAGNKGKPVEPTTKPTAKPATKPTAKPAAQPVEKKAEAEKKPEAKQAPQPGARRAPGR